MRMEKCTRCGVVWNVSVHLHIPGVYVCLACEDKQSRILRKSAQKKSALHGINRNKAQTN